MPEDRLCKATRVMVATRKREKISGKKFAVILGRSEAWIRKMEAGNSEPGYETLCRFIRRFRVDPRELFDEWKGA